MLNRNKYIYISNLSQCKLKSYLSNYTCATIVFQDMVLLLLEESPIILPYFLASHPVNWNSLFRVHQKSLCSYRGHQAYSASPCTLAQIYFSYLLLSYKTFSKWPPRASRHAFIGLVVYERNGVIVPPYYRFTVTAHCIWNIYLYDQRMQGRTDGRTEGRTNIPANGTPQEHRATEILVNKGITKTFCFSKPVPWNTIPRYSPKC